MPVTDNSPIPPFALERLGVGVGNRFYGKEVAVEAELRVGPCSFRIGLDAHGQCYLPQELHDDTLHFEIAKAFRAAALAEIKRRWEAETSRDEERLAARGPSSSRPAP